MSEAERILTAALPARHEGVHLPPRMAEWPSDTGAYALIIALPRSVPIPYRAGREVTFARGFNIYTGSALGPGGLRARIGRHLSPIETKRPHWHIDRLLEASLGGRPGPIRPEMALPFWRLGLRLRWASDPDAVATGHPAGMEPSETRVSRHPPSVPTIFGSHPWRPAMKHRIRILAADLEWTAELLDNETGSAIWEALPIEGKVHRWGEEIYFEIPVKLPEASDARQEMAVGELAYWPVGADPRQCERRAKSLLQRQPMWALARRSDLPVRCAGGGHPPLGENRIAGG